MRPDVEHEIRELIMDAGEAYTQPSTEKHKNIYERLGKIKGMVDDTYNIVDMWYDSGCEFPFEATVITEGKEQTVEFNSIREMLSTIRLLK